MNFTLFSLTATYIFNINAISITLYFIEFHISVSEKVRRITVIDWKLASHSHFPILGGSIFRFQCESHYIDANLPERDNTLHQKIILAQWKIESLVLTRGTQRKCWSVLTVNEWKSNVSFVIFFPTFLLFIDGSISFGNCAGCFYRINPLGICCHMPYLNCE